MRNINKWAYKQQGNIKNQKMVLGFECCTMYAPSSSPPQRCSVSSEERDVYEELLTQQEVQGCIDLLNGKRWWWTTMGDIL